MESSSSSEELAGARKKRTGEDRIFTIPNLLSFIRLLMIPVFFWLYVFAGQEVAGMIVFAVAACTDWVDGTVARATNSVTKLGKTLDPLVDRILIIFGVIAVVVVGRMPLWIMILVFARDIILGTLSIYMKRVHGNDFTVSYVGKFATAFMMVAFCMLMLNWPIVPGLGWFEISWLPGFGAEPYSLGIFLAYIGVVLQWTVAVIYLYRGIRYGTTAKDHGMSTKADAGSAE
ncbi:MAG: CDP-alcohol phosphatidyltransferase family protein [Coriobacteriales bacterium]|jgi:cardiolipin synthase